MKLLSIALGLSLLLLTPASYANDRQPEQDVTLQLIWKHQFQFAGYYIAKEKGFYQDVSIAVDIREFEGGMDVVKVIEEGEADFAVGRSSLLVDFVSGSDIVALFPAFQKSPMMLLSLASSQIKEPADLRNRKVMLTQGAEQIAEIKTMMLQAGLRDDDFTRQNHSFNLQDLIDGTTDAMASYVSNEPYHLKQAGIEYTVLHPADYGFDVYSDILFTSHRLAIDQPDLVNRFKQASIRGWQYAFENIEETAKLIHEKYNSQNRSLEALRFEGEALKKLAYDSNGHFGTLSLAKLNTTGHLYLMTGAVPVGFDMRPFIFQPDSLMLSVEEREYLDQLTSVTLCVQSNWAPYESFSEGQYQGLVKDYAELIAARLGLGINVVPTTSWSQALNRMRTGECDLIPGTMSTPLRSRFLQFSNPYLNMPAVLAIHDASEANGGKVDLGTRRLAVVHDSPFYDILQNRYPNTILVPVDDVQEGLRRVETGNVYGLVDAPASISRALQDNHMLGIRIYDSLNDQWDLSVATRRNDELLLLSINHAIASLTDEDHQTIANRWLNVRYAHEYDYTLLWQTIGILLLLLLLVAYRYKMVADYNSKLEAMAQYDQLTGIYNRHKLYAFLEHELSLVRRYERPCSVIFFDVDDFKQINDNYGHNEDDRVLIGLSEVVSNTLRLSDTFGRWGGEEFLVILPESRLRHTRLIAEKLRANIEDYDFYLGASSITCSFGITELAPEDSPESLISRVDRALYKAKSAGKNCVQEPD